MMAHRLPLGTTCRLHFANDAWGGIAPDLGDYLQSAASTVYLVVGVEEGPRRTTYVCERVEGYPAESFVFDFYWLSRG